MLRIVAMKKSRSHSMNRVGRCLDPSRVNDNHGRGRCDFRRLVELSESSSPTGARIARLVEAGAQARSKYVRLADKAAGIYVPVVHTAAAATFAIGWALGLGP